MASDYLFSGKLSIFAILLEGGEREMRPFDFQLSTLGDKRVTLRRVLDSVGAKDTYIGAEDILFLVGPDDSLIVRNNSSKITLKAMGRDYGYRTKLQLQYTNKMYLVFEKGENEMEISYKQAPREEVTASAIPINFNIGRRR